MKQHKINPKPQPNVAARTQDPKQIRQEIDTFIAHIGEMIKKDPKKAAKIFDSWINKPSKSKSSKKAA